ncbi:MAG: alpha-ketoglutarate-dependent dioxygenase AlkB [Frankia sp.]
MTLGEEPRIEPGAPTNRVWLGSGAWVEVAPGWLRGADALFEHLAAEVPWRQGKRWMYERVVDDPRLSHWYSSEDELPHPALGAMRTALERRCGVRFGAVGLNYYRDGKDSVAPHRDRELKYLDSTLIAIVTLGGQRPFHLRRIGGGASHRLQPASGDLLVMGGTCQRLWEHGVPKVAGADPRISVSMRWSSGRGREEHVPAWRPYGIADEPDAASSNQASGNPASGNPASSAG